jgi:hypothetical protein
MSAVFLAGRSFAAVPRGSRDSTRATSCQRERLGVCAALPSLTARRKFLTPIHRLFKARWLCDIGMKMLIPLALCLIAAPSVAEPADRRGDQAEAFEARRQGKIMPLREIERRIVPQLRGAQYLGVEFDSYSSIYTLKFLRDGTVIWVDVDGRSGQILRQTGR